MSTDTLRAYCTYHSIPIGVLCDNDIRLLCENKNMITPYHGELINKDENGNKLISYGLSSTGYDVTLANEFLVLKSDNLGILDPKQPNDDNFEYIKTDDPFILPPGGFLLSRTNEHIHMPIDVVATCLGKSTYARNGIIVHVTPLEAGWAGYVTLEISNVTSMPVKIYPNEGICQFIFNKVTNIPTVTYNTRGGKYMNQTGIVLGKV